MTAESIFKSELVRKTVRKIRNPDPRDRFTWQSASRVPQNMAASAPVLKTSKEQRNLWLDEKVKPCQDLAMGQGDRVCWCLVPPGIETQFSCRILLCVGCV